MATEVELLGGPKLSDLRAKKEELENTLNIVHKELKHFRDVMLESKFKTERERTHELERALAACHAKMDSEVNALRREFDGKIDYLENTVCARIQEQWGHERLMLEVKIEDLQRRVEENE